MRSILIIGLGAILVYILSIFLPWYNLFIGGFIIGWIFSLTKWQAFYNGFLSGFILWLLHGFVLNMSQGEYITPKIAELIGVPNGFLLITGSALISGVCMGSATWLARSFKQLFQKDLKYKKLGV